jgi:hypothetical protein
VNTFIILIYDCAIFFDNQDSSTIYSNFYPVDFGVIPFRVAPFIDPEVLTIDANYFSNGPFVSLIISSEVDSSARSLDPVDIFILPNTVILNRFR